MIKEIFVNLPVKDLPRAKKFFESVGFSFNPQFTDDKAGCLILGNEKYAMLLTREYFKTFIKKDITDAHTETEVLIACSVEKKETVDDILDKALRAGAHEPREPQNLGFMYGRAFEDLDGHIWEILWMDPSQMPNKE